MPSFAKSNHYKSMKSKYLVSLKTVLFVVSLFCSASAFSQAVLFPASAKPGEAQISVAADNGSWTLSNNLFAVSFVKQNGSLFFGGSEKLGLVSGTELFNITLGNGTLVKASEMTQGEINVVKLAAKDSAVKGSDRFGGESLEALFSYGNLSIVWRAVLRDGSHYLRTEMEISANGNQEMSSIVPMLYTVNNESGNTVPQVVGNTRGAIIVSNKIFAGLETPMGLNTVSGSNAQEVISSFKAKEYSKSSWFSIDAEGIPKGVTNLGYTAEQILVAQGYVRIKEAGSNVITFQHVSGNLKLIMAGVDMLKADGSVCASDYHNGSTGNASDRNAYTLNVSEPGIYLVRYFVQTKAEGLSTSAGTITYNKAISQPIVVVKDAVDGSDGKQVVISEGNEASGGAAAESSPKASAWTPSSFVSSQSVPEGVIYLGFDRSVIREMTIPASIGSDGRMAVEFLYASGSNRLNVVGVDLLSDGQEVAHDYHVGFTGTAASANIYELNVPVAGSYTLRFFAETKTEAINSSGNINITYPSGIKADTVYVYKEIPPTTDIQGLWSRATTLKAGKTWTVGAVVGLIAPQQARRSVLAYSERERAVPWRAFPLYNSWYELNINRNNSEDYSGNMKVAQCVEVVKQWKKNLYDKYNTGISSFIWDDGWDEYGTWTFNKNFPDGFSEPSSLATDMGSAIGAWLGPVGGYGTSGNYRRNYWNGKGGMQLSNEAYYNVFLSACTNMIKDYNFSAFKFDGISAQFSSVGPDAGSTGIENAEAIINIESEVRKIKEDIHLNTTVGTWASPFWFRYTDAVWRQENDFGTTGVGNDREKWITYRDRLVYQNFIQNSPLCPINTLMTHGMILSNYGGAGNREYASILNEMRCAFGCGSGMVELYLDYTLMNTINNGALWGELAKCIAWQKGCADVLPDVHWVGGNPWDATKNAAEIYGWAAWSESSKSTLTLRNPSNSTKTFTSTLRKVLDIPAHVKGVTMKMVDAFEGQTSLAGLTDTWLDIDKEFTVSMPAFTVVVFNGGNSSVISSINNALVNSSNANNIDIYPYNGAVGFRNVPSDANVSITSLDGVQIKQYKAPSSAFTDKLKDNKIYLIQVTSKNGLCLASAKLAVTR